MFRLTREADRIYLLHFDRGLDLGLTFLRYEEFYESENPLFYRRPFTLASFVRWYAQEYRAFTYAHDWIGFNLPVRIIRDVQSAGIADPNHHDAFMLAVAQYVENDSKSRDCYLIGVSGDGAMYAHEMAHALYYTRDEYRDAANASIAALPDEVRTKLCKRVRELGYAESSVLDEVQAYAVDRLSFIWTGRRPPELRAFVRAIGELYAKHAPVKS